MEPTGALDPSRRVRCLVATDGVVGFEHHQPAALRPCEVRVETEVVALNTFGPPSGQGREVLGDAFVGRVAEVGTDVDPRTVGHRVMGIARNGSAMSELVVPSRSVYGVQERLPGDVLPIVVTSGLAARCLVTANPLEPGSIVVVNDASDAAACFMAGMLRANDVRAFAVNTHPSIESALGGVGFEAAVTAGHHAPAEALTDLTGGRLADLVIDCSHAIVPWSSIEPLLAPGAMALRWIGGDPNDWDPARTRTIALVAELARVFSPSDDLMPAMGRHVVEITDDLTAGRLNVPIHVFECDDAQAAYDLVRAPFRLGRVVVHPPAPLIA